MIILCHVNLCIIECVLYAVVFVLWVGLMSYMNGDTGLKNSGVCCTVLYCNGV